VTGHPASLNRDSLWGQANGYHRQREAGPIADHDKDSVTTWKHGDVKKGHHEGRTRTECSQVEVLVAGDAADARLPPPVLVMPAADTSIRFSSQTSYYEHDFLLVDLTLI